MEKEMKEQVGNSKIEIVKALVKAQSEIGTITKNKKNPIARSSYATLDTILEEVLPKLNENGLFFTQKPFTRNVPVGNGGVIVEVGVETTLYHESGESLVYEPFFMAIEDNKRMNQAQSAGSIITYAKRYAISAILGISTDEDTDGVQGGDYEKHEPKKDMTLEDAKKFVLNFGKNKGKTLGELSKTDKSYLRWLLNNATTDDVKQAVRLIGQDMAKKEDGEVTVEEEVAMNESPYDYM